MTLHLIMIPRQTSLLLKLSPKGFFPFPLHGPTASVALESPPWGCREGVTTLYLAKYAFLLRTTCLLQLSPSFPPSLPLSLPHSLLCPPFPLAVLSAFPSLCSGPLGPVIIRKRGRRGAILAHQGFRRSWDYILETRVCKGFSVFLLFQP